MAQGPGGIGSRRLLRNLRDLMAAALEPQERLDRIVSLIAADLVAEVCSLYVRRAGEVLELFATEGLRKEAVHKTRLRVGEGLVGDIAAHARPVALADAQSHPGFAYRPETGEEVYRSLMGVPILRAGRVIGVLVVQNRTRRQYEDEEVEALQTIAMVLAEVITSGELVSPQELVPADGIAVRPLRLEGLSFNGGLAVGEAVLHEPRIIVHNIVADNVDAELKRLGSGLETMYSALDDMLSAPDMKGDGEHVQILEAYRMFAEDRGWLQRIHEAIRTGLTAEGAVQRVADDLRAKLGQAQDPYLRERLHDLEDLSDRLLRHLTGTKASEPAPLPEDAIVIARGMGPADLLGYDREKLRGLVLEEGSPTGHVAIVARALDIPVVGRIAGVIDQIDAGDPIIVDGDNGQVFVRPDEEVHQTFQESLENLRRRRAALAAMRDLPAVSRDGIRVALGINAGLLIDLKGLEESGADGIGLYRTEIPFMTRRSLPSVEQQAQIYAKALDQADGKPVVFRTLDVGGEKMLPYLKMPRDENPAMGWRAIRIALDRPALLRQQLRGLLRAAAGRELRVMFPMIAEVAEFDAARRLLDDEMARARARGHGLPARTRVGVMLEVPALVWQLPVLLPRVDFLSIGSNDLLQFVFASDRGNPRLAGRYDSLAPSVLGLLRQVARICAECDVPLTLCGEMAARPLEAMALIGLGFRTLSMPAPAIAAVKSMIRSLDIASLESYMDGFEHLPDHSVRQKLRAFALDHGVAVA